MKKETQRKGNLNGKSRLGFGLICLGNVPMSMLVQSFLLIFYTNVVGLSPAACATLFLIARVVDGVNDPLVGFLLDKVPNTKMGHFRLTIMIGSVICSINFLLMWMGPLMATGWKLLIAYTTYFLHGILFPIMDISLNGLMPAMSTDKKDRDGLNIIHSIMAMIGGVAISVVGPVLIGDTNAAGGYVLLIIATVIFVAATSVSGAALVKEHTESREENTGYSLKELLKVLTLKPVYVLFFANLFYYIALAITQTVNSYFYTYVIGNLSLMGVIMLVDMFAMFPGIFLSGRLTDKIGKKNVYAIGAVCATMLGVFRLIDIDSIPLLVALNIVMGFGQGLMTPHFFGMMADNMDYAEIHEGLHAEGAIGSLQSFVTKCANGVGGALPAYLLALVGFEGTAAVQPQAVIDLVSACSALLPAIFGIFSVIIMKKMYPLNNDDLKEQQRKLAEIRGENMEGANE